MSSQELVSKLVDLYSFTVAFNSLDVKSLNEIKLHCDDVRPDIIFHDGRKVDKSYIKSSFGPSLNYFSLHYNNQIHLEEIRKIMMT